MIPTLSSTSLEVPKTSEGIPVMYTVPVRDRHRLHKHKGDSSSKMIPLEPGTPLSEDDVIWLGVRILSIFKEFTFVLENVSLVTRCHQPRVPQGQIYTISNPARWSKAPSVGSTTRTAISTKLHNTIVPPCPTPTPIHSRWSR
jgi:hypothetical protein